MVVSGQSMDSICMCTGHRCWKKEPFIKYYKLQYIYRSCVSLFAYVHCLRCACGPMVVFFFFHFLRQFPWSFITTASVFVCWRWYFWFAWFVFISNGKVVWIILIMYHIARHHDIWYFTRKYGIHFCLVEWVIGRERVCVGL